VTTPGPSEHPQDRLVRTVNAALLQVLNVALLPTRDGGGLPVHLAVIAGSVAAGRLSDRAAGRQCRSTRTTAAMVFYGALLLCSLVNHP